MKKLILIGGITAKPYIRQALTESTLDTSHYAVAPLPYDSLLDERYAKIPFYNHMPWVDKYGDAIQFLHKKIRDRVRRHIKLAIDLAKAGGYEVDIIAHSLGAWALLGCDVSVHNVYLIGCPLGSMSRLVRRAVEQEPDGWREFLNPFHKSESEIKLQANQIHYYYNRHDKVSTRHPKQEIIDQLKSEIILCEELGDGHNAVDYFNAMNLG